MPVLMKIDQEMRSGEQTDRRTDAVENGFVICLMLSCSIETDKNDIALNHKCL